MLTMTLGLRKAYFECVKVGRQLLAGEMACQSSAYNIGRQMGRVRDRNCCIDRLLLDGIVAAGGVVMALVDPQTLADD